MVKKKIVESKEVKKPRIRLTLEQYQRAIQRAKEPEVVQRLQNIYRKSEESRQTQKATRIAKRTSKGLVGYGISRTKISAGEKEFTTKARKLINLISPKGSLVKSLTYGGGVSRGRGRPVKSYKPRFVPGVGYVRVPTAVYNRMISEYKTRQRLLQAQKMAVAEQQALQTDPRYQPDYSDEQFLSEPDLQMEQPTQQLQQIPLQEQPQQQGQPNFIQRLSQNISRLGGAPRSQYGQQPMRNPFYDPPQNQLYGNRGYQQPQQQMGQVVREPRVTVVSERSSLLTPKGRTIGFN